MSVERHRVEEDSQGGIDMSSVTPVISRRRLMAAAAIAIPAVGLARMLGSQDVGAADVAVTIMNFSFQPTPLTIPLGTTVVWTNQDTAPHTATSDPGSAFTFDTGMLQKGQAGRVTFTTAGTFAYHCTVHPNMHGTVTVTAQAPGGTTTTPAATTGTAPAATPTKAATTPAAPSGTTVVPPVTQIPAPSPTSGPKGLPPNFIRRLGDG
jgi:plastocyanin